MARLGVILAAGLVWAASIGGAGAAAPGGNAGGGDTIRMSAVAWATASAPASGAARAIGGYAGGCVQGAVALPSEGPGYQAIRLSRKRNYGHPILTRYLQELGRQAERQGLGVMMIADLSQPRGGPMPNGHASHQIGLDADIWLRLDQPLLSRQARETPTAIRYVDYDRMDIARDWTEGQRRLVKLAASDSRVDRIFVHPVIKRELCRAAGPADGAWLARVRPWWGHDAHMHVRLSCPADSPDCAPQKPPPPGDGCGEEVESWIADATRPVESKPPGEQKPRVATLPKACQAVLKNRAAVRNASFPESGASNMAPR